MHTGFLIAAVPCGLIGLAGWHSHRVLRRREAAARPAPAATATVAAGAAPALPVYVLGKAPLAAEALPAEAMLRDVLRALDAEAAGGLARFTLAVAPGLALRADPAALGHVLREVVGGAVRRSPYGRVLVCAAPHGGRVQVSVTDDGGAGAGEDALAGLSEAARGIVALHGGTLEARSHPGGATVVLRLPAPPERPRGPAPAHPEAAPAGAPDPDRAPPGHATGPRESAPASGPHGLVPD